MLRPNLPRLSCRPAALVLVLGLAVAMMPTAGAQSPDEIRKEREQKERALESINADIEKSREAQAALNAEVAALAEDRAALNEELIGTAAEIQRLESTIDGVENRIDALAERETALRTSLHDRSGLLSELLGALQRMGRRPPPAVLATPEDALKTVRTAMLLGAVLPGLRIETEALASDLSELVRLKREIGAERDQLRAETRSLEVERRRIAALVDAKRESMERSESELATVRERVSALATQAQDTEELIASLDREIAVAARAADDSAPPPSPEDVRGALSDPSRLEPAVPFGSAKGLLPMPASGAVIRTFGAADEYGSPSKGVSLATRAGAQITSPADGWVVYAGPFRSYGQLLILNASDGYHVLLAGMERISVELGQFVLAGEPVGAMGELIVASTENVTVGRRQPVLYVEFRKDGRSIDPAPWWAASRTGVGG